MKKLVTVLMIALLVVSFGFSQAEQEAATDENAITQIKISNEAPIGDLEIFSWWAGDEAPALKAMVADFEKRYPNVNLINATVTGGSGVNAKAVLKTRMLGGDPPEAFQVHAGQELIGTWVDSNRMYDLTPLFDQNGWFDVFPKDLIGLIGTEDGIWSVPVCVHKSNEMWYIPANLEKWGVTVPTTLDEFFMVADKLQAKGIIPLSVGQTWTVVEDWENVCLAVLGSDDYNALWAGELAWTDPKMEKVWTTFNRVLDYTNDDAASLSWQQATDMVVSGKAAFNFMGDWAAGYMMTTLNLKAGTGFGWANAPGTVGVFQFLSDSFGIPKGCKNENAAVAWLTECGSKAGQDAFNPLKGSIPARIDADMSLYSAYSQNAAMCFANDTIVGSLAHGCVANEGFMNDFSSLMSKFISDRDVAGAMQACAEIAKSNGITD